MKKRRMWAGLMAGAMAVGSLAGCGGGGASTTAAPTTAASQTETTAAAAGGDTTTAAASGEQVTIKVSLWDYSNTDYYKTIFSAFEAKYPNIKVEAVEASSAEYDDLIQVKMASKEDFDVVFTKGTPALSALVAKGHVLELDDYIAQSGIDEAVYSGLTQQMQLNGKTYAVPFRKDNNLLFYNKDLFDAAGVAYPEDGMTMDEFREMAKTLTSGEGSSKVYGAHIHTWASNVN